jgi:hypothetical protein
MDCAKCGHELGLGRYCTNCGHPVDAVDAAAPDDDLDWRTGTAERPATPAAPRSESTATPPPAWTPPPAARFPLFADEVDQIQPAPTEQAPVEYAVPPSSHRHRSRSWNGVIALGVVAVLALVLGIWLVATGDDDEPPGPAGKAPSTSASATSDPGQDPSSEAPVGLTAESQVTVPETAGPGQDTEGNPVDYEASNMLDGVPETCWRMPGDGTGEEIVITLPARTKLRSVGLINGYAKQGGDIDWYHGNRRIEQVEWVFDDGTTVPQTLADTESVQSIDVDVRTTTITLRLVQVSAPGKGPSRRDFTAISDLLFVGR